MEIDKAASSHHPGHQYLDNSFDEENDFGDYDIAITHDRNTKLKERDMVKTFFEAVRKYKSLADHETRSWLGNLPFYMRQDAIPLFVDGDDSRDDSEDYQLHPCYSLLELGKIATHPHDDLFQLYCDGKLLEVPNLVTGIGRLFVNVSNGKAGRTSKWTGYEVFVDQELALWMVFDRHSINFRAVDWYPTRCRLSSSILQESGDEERVEIACFLSSLHDLADSKFKAANEEVQKTRKPGKITVGQVERSEVDKLLETQLAPQDFEWTATIQKLLQSDAGTADSYDLSEIASELGIAVNDGRKNGPMIADLFEKYKDSPSMIGKVITKTNVAVAAGNIACGGQIMTKLLDKFPQEICKNISTEVLKAAAENTAYGDQIITRLLHQFPYEVCKNISTTVVKAAAGNLQYGEQIMGNLITQCKGAVSKNISDEVIRSAAENQSCGARVLALLLQVNENFVKRLILEVLRIAGEGKGWQAQLSSDQLKEIGSLIAYPATSGRQVDQHFAVVQRGHGFEIEQEFGIGSYHHVVFESYPRERRYDP